MDLAVLRAIADELNEILCGAYINKIHQPLPREIVLRLRVPRGGEKRLVLSADPKLGRMHLTSVRVPNPPAPPRFCQYLRAHLQGGKVIQVTGRTDDRVVRITAIRGSDAGPVSRELVLELLGRDSNILLVDGESGIILDCLHQIPEHEGRTRAVLPGRQYVSPPSRPSGPARHDVINGTAEPVPGIARGTGGTACLTIAARPETDRVFPSMNKAADALYLPLIQGSLVEAFRKELSAPLKARIRSLDRRLEKVEQDRRRMEAFAEAGESGELLKANLGRAAKGMRTLEVTDWNTGQPRTIRLDPALGGVANMERLFKKASKGKRGQGFVEQRLADTASEKRSLEDLLFFVENAGDITELERLAEDLPFSGQSPQRAERTEKPGRESAESGMYHEFTSPTGKLVLVGRSGRGNDLILRRKAKKGDLWLHVKDYPGAHVLVPLRTHAGASESDVEFAARLAVIHSKARDKGKVEVIVADAGEIARPKGALPGQVTVKRHRTVMSDGTSVPDVSA